MNFRINLHLLMTIAAVAVVSVLATHSPASASSPASSGTVLNFSQTSNALIDVENFLKGPVAFGISVLAVVVGAFMVFNGQDMGQGIKVIGTVALTLGFLAAVGSLFSSQAASAIPDGTGISYGYYALASTPHHLPSNLR